MTSRITGRTCGRWKLGLQRYRGKIESVSYSLGIMAFNEYFVAESLTDISNKTTGNNLPYLSTGRKRKAGCSTKPSRSEAIPSLLPTSRSTGTAARQEPPTGRG